MLDSLLRAASRRRAGGRALFRLTRRNVAGLVVTGGPGRTLDHVLRLASAADDLVGLEQDQPSSRDAREPTAVAPQAGWRLWPLPVFALVVLLTTSVLTVAWGL